MSAYPPNFSSWSQDERNTWFASATRNYRRQINLAEKQSENSVRSEPFDFSEVASTAKPGNASFTENAHVNISRLATLARSLEPIPLAPPMAAARPYPVEALGKTLAGAAESIATKIQCPPAMAAQSVLAVASLAVQRLVDVRLPYGQTRPLSLSLVTIAASGERKTTADNEALSPVQAHERNLRQDYDGVYSEWRVSFAAWDAERRKIENDKKLDRNGRVAALKALGSAPSEPVRPILTAPEPTVEGLAKHWQALPGSLGLFSSEGGQMTGGHGFGPDHRLKTATELSKLWDGCGIRRLRAGDGVSDIPGRRLALHLMVQPDVAEAFLSDRVLRDQGLLSRILIAAPQSLAGTRMWREPAPELDHAMRLYFAVILGLLERAAPAANAAGNELTPRPIEFSPEAHGVWVAFYNKIEAQLAEDGSLETIQDVAAKAAENAARMAGVLTVINDPDAPVIGIEEMKSGCRLMAWYVGEALRLSGTYRLPLKTRNAVKLLRWLFAKGKTEITRSEVIQMGPGSVRRKDDAEAAINVLEEHGWLRPSPPDGKGLRWSVVRAD